MSLQGTIRQLGLADVIQTALAGRQGTLYVRNGAQRAVLYVAENQLRLVEPDPIHADYMLTGFVHRGLLQAEMREEARARRSTGAEQVDYLIEKGVLPRPEVEGVVRDASEDAILDLMTWQKGEFRFEEGEKPESGGLVSRVPVDVGGVLLRAAQRLDERSAIVDGLGLEAHLFVAVGAPPESQNEGAPEALVHSLLDGQHIVDEVALLAGITRFTTLRTVLLLTQAGAARPADSAELSSAAEARAASDQPHVARAILLQWAGQANDTPVPLMRLAELARANKRVGEEADALLALGHLYLQLGQPSEAIRVLQDLTKRFPGDTRVLSALNEAAEVTGDRALQAQATVQLAEAALKDDEPQRAAHLLQRVTEKPDAPLVARVLRGRAFLHLRDRQGLIEEAEAAAEQIGERAKTREQKEAAAFFRDAVANMAPERGDLLRCFGARKRRAPVVRRVALVLALLAIAGSAGFVLWPASPAQLLAQAEEAHALGNDVQALAFLARLADKHPNAPETAESYVLLTQIQATRRPTPPRPVAPGSATPKPGTSGPATPPPDTTPPPVTPKPPTPPDGPETVEEAVAACEAGLLRLPSEASVAAIRGLTGHLAMSRGPALRARVMQRLRPVLCRVGDRLARDGRKRQDAIQQAETIADRAGLTTGVLRAWVDEAHRYLTDDHPARLLAAAAALESLFGADLLDEEARVLRQIRQAHDQLTRVRNSQAEAVDRVRAHLAERLLEEAYRRCRTDAPRLLVSGRFDQADAVYVEMEKHLETLGRDPAFAWVKAQAVRRRFPQFVADRRAGIAEVRLGLDSAKAAEAAGDFTAAVQAYTSLARRFWHIRFENIVELPLQVDSTPGGAEVRLNGKEIGVTPLVAHYPWGSPVTLVVEAPGYEKGTRFLEPGPEPGPSRIHFGLEPHRLWSVPVEDTVRTAPVVVGKNVIVVERTGRLQKLCTADGRGLWARHIETLEGIRLRPLVVGRTVYLPFVDGSVVLLDLKDGSRLKQMQTGRPVGPGAQIDDDIAIAGLDKQLHLLRGEQASRVALGGAPSAAGVLAAHGAFWVGMANGSVVRHTPRGSPQRIALSRSGAAVAGFAADDRGVLVTLRDGTLRALDTRGRVRWSVDSLGDVVGSPAVAGSLVAAVDARGRVLLFSRADGSPHGQIDLQDRAPHGLLGTHGLLVACLAEGRLWIHDPETGRDLANVPVGGSPTFPATALDADRLAVPTGDGLTVYRLPAR